MKSYEEISRIATGVLDNEAQAILNLRKAINQDFYRALGFIYNSKGRVIISGIGKSALIAQKIVATLNSTGTPSVFMHAADAVHGDLGIVQQDDVVIIISKSGNTAEIKVLVPLLKIGGNHLIAMVGAPDSYLAQQADCILDTTIEVEACPHNLAPTTSTAAQMAMGDALAVCLLSIRDFGSRDFARFHPGGALGKRLYLRVEDITDQNLKPEIEANARLQEIILEITSKRQGAVAVMEDGKLQGMITDGDLRRMLEKNADLTKVTARDIMSPHPHTIEHDALAVRALRIIRENKVQQLIVMKHNRYIGMVHFHDLNREGLI
ncbi:MAG: KpsF/GutQ family sugar-phosphate isomerase [Bacteroidia bacterium]